MNSVGWQNLKHVTVIPVPPLAKAIEQSTEDGPLPYSNYIIQKVVNAIIDNATKL
jgi:hypothetical protein